MLKRFQKLWIALGVFMVLSPLGLIATGTAFGEWGVDQLKEEAGFIPQGLARFADLWPHSPFPDYSVPGMDGSFFHSAIGYILSAVVGVVLVVLITTLFGKVVDE